MLEVSLACMLEFVLVGKAKSRGIELHLGLRTYTDEPGGVVI